MAEVPETALAVLQGTGMATCAAVSAAGLRAFQIPEGVSTVDIWTDLDASKTGEQAATELATRIVKTGLTAYIRIAASPIPEGMKSVDWLDALNSDGAETFQCAMERGEPWKPAETGSEKSAGFQPPAYWQLLDVADVDNWKCAPLQWIMEHILARGNMVFVAAASEGTPPD